MAHARFVDVTLHGGQSDGSGEGSAPDEDDALDAYSKVITRVAERLIPSVANLRVSRRGWRGADAQGGGIYATGSTVNVTGSAGV